MLIASAGQAKSAPAPPAVVVEQAGHLYALALDGSSRIQLTKTRLPGFGVYGEGSGAALSPDGSRVAFSRGGGISIMKRDGSDRKIVTRGTDGSPTWTVDGRTIYFVRYHSNRFGAPCGSIFAVSVSGTNLRRVTDSSGSGHSHIDPAASPDGRAVAFSDWNACEGGTAGPRLRVVDTSGRETADLAHLPRNNYSGPEHSCPAWSPDGRRIAYRRGASLAVANRDGSGERRLIRGRVSIYEPPAWSADGRWIAFPLFEKGLQIVHPDGGGLRRMAIQGDYELVGWLRRSPS